MRYYLTSKFIIFIFSVFLISCSTPKFAYFNNSYSGYSSARDSDQEKTTEKEQPEVVPNDISASTETIPVSVQKPAELTPEEPDIQAVEKKNKQISEQELSNLKEDIHSSFDNMTKKEKRIKKRAIRKEIRESLKESKTDRTQVNTLLLVIIAILLPPLAVALVDGLTGPFWLSLLLTLLFYIPGLIYALYRIFKT